MSKHTTDDFVKKAIIVHNNRYDYSLVQYIDSVSKVKIICPIHGVFDQTPNIHIQGGGCKKCVYDYYHNKYSLTTNKFIQIALQVHSNKYNYSKVNYVNNHTKVCIICPEHGEFWQIPVDHIRSKRGCRRCKKIGGNIRDTAAFIKQSIEIHGYKYDYSDTIYKNIRNKVTIFCYEHGSFTQSPLLHLRGCGCPVCKNSKGEQNIKSILDQINIKFVLQKTFNDCKNPKTNYKLRFDFYLPDYNTCIEFDGKQHFKEGVGSYLVNHILTIEEYEEVVYRDLIKTIYCAQNNINLMRINYKQNIKQEMIKIIEGFK